jgi:putative oxidoreductase
MASLSNRLSEDVGRLLLRLPVGGLMLFHGVHKAMHGHGFIEKILAQHGLPKLLWIGVPIGEILAPLCILLGVFTRLSALMVVVTMLFSLYLVFGTNSFALTEHGGLRTELNLFYLFAGLALMFLGSGRYALYRGNNKWLS